MTVGLRARRSPQPRDQQGSPVRGWQVRPLGSLAVAGLASATIASGVLLLVLGAQLTFMADDWQFLIDRQEWSVDNLLDPHNEHIVLLPVAVYKVLLAAFGMDSAFPFRVVSTLLFLTSAVLLFIYLRRRVGDLLALAGTVLVLFLGGAYEDLLWSFQMGLIGAMAAGLGMLLALERKDATGDRIACLLLAGSLAFSSLGLSFAAGAAVEIGTRPGRWRRSYIVAIPALLFAIWWLGWGHTAESAVSLHNFGLMPVFVANAIASGLSSLLGLSIAAPEGLISAPLDWGRPLLVLAAGLAAWRLYRLGRVPRWLWVVAAVGFSFWALAALNAIPGREATASRYQYVSAICILLAAAELARGVQVKRGVMIAIFSAVALAVTSNITLLHQQYKAFRTIGQIERADLGALEIARGTVDPAFGLSPETADAVILVLAGPYFTAAADYGSPAYTPREIASAPEQARVAADKVLAAALAIGLEPVRGSLPRGPAPTLKGPPEAQIGSRPGCLTVRTTVRDAPLLEVPEGGVALRAAKGAAAQVRLRRFAQQSIPVDLGRLKSGAAALLAIPADSSNVPWKLSLQGTGPVTVCGAAG